MSVIHNDLLLATDEATGYNLTKSLRFRASASAYLNRTPASSGNRTTWTMSIWFKRGTLSTEQHIFEGASSPASANQFYFNTDNTLVYNDNATNYFTTSQVFRDPSAWYHMVVVWNTGNATASDRIRFYINGSRVTNFSASNNPSLNATSTFNDNVRNVIGQLNNLGGYYFDGYMAETNFIDGQALTPSSFGENNATTGVWQPKKYTGTYGTNGFYLPFTDVATTSGSNAGLGKDFSGNGNYWTTNNISVTAGTTYDSMTDVPTLTSATAANYAVLNPLQPQSTTAPINGNLRLTTTNATWYPAFSSFYLTTGKFYYETTVTSLAGSGGIHIGIQDNNPSVTFIGGVGYNVAYRQDGTKYVNNANSSYGATFTAGDVIGCAVDLTGGTVTFYKNGTSQGAISYTFVNPMAMAFSINGNGGTTTGDANFGQRPFAYTPPTGYLALNTYNLPDSTIVAGNKYMDATIWTGDNTTPRSIANAASFKPDFIWIKSRSNAYQNNLYDSVRGAGAAYALSSDQTAAEGGNSNVYGYLSAFNSTGFAVTQGSAGSGGAPNGNAYTNQTSTTYVGWQWQAGQGSTSSNTSGSITSTVSVNASAGFSVVTWTAPSSGTATIGHGLGVAPQFIITRARGITADWYCYHQSLGSNAYIVLNTTAAQVTGASGVWNNTSPTSTVFSTGVGYANYGTMVAYCWSEIAGFSKFGSYTGNGSADGPFVYTGFRPKFVLIKSSSGAFYWVIEDSTRNSYNAVDLELFPNDSLAETNASRPVDFLSNGFKIRHTGTTQNSSGGSYIYAAYAENPFKNSLAR